MAKPLTHKQLLFELHKNIITYEYLLYSNALTYNHFIKDDAICNVQSDYLYVDKPENMNNISSHIELYKQSLVNEITQFGNSQNVNYLNALSLIHSSSAHFVRTRALNITLELIVNYVEGKGESKFDLHNHNWFKVLYVLRNSASHADNYNKPIKFPFFKGKITPYPNTIEWETITITKGQADPVRYNDREVLNLIVFVLNFYANNP